MKQQVKMYIDFFNCRTLFTLELWKLYWNIKMLQIRYLTQVARNVPEKTLVKSSTVQISMWIVKHKSYSRKFYARFDIITTMILSLVILPNVREFICWSRQLDQMFVKFGYFDSFFIGTCKTKVTYHPVYY